MTYADFIAFYPQFSEVPYAVAHFHVDQANLRFDDLLESTEEARMLYVAHKLTMYARSYAPDGASMSKLTDTGSSAQVLSKSVGGVSVSRQETSGTSSISGWNEWKQTIYGVQLISLCKLYMAGGLYVP